MSRYTSNDITQHTKNSTKQICESSVRIMYCREINPRLSIRIDTLLERLRAFVEGLSNDVLYLEGKVRVLKLALYAKIKAK